MGPGVGKGVLLLPGLHWFTSGLVWPGSKHGVSVRWAHGELWGSESRRGLPLCGQVSLTELILQSPDEDCAGWSVTQPTPSPASN